MVQRLVFVFVALHEVLIILEEPGVLLLGGLHLCLAPTRVFRPARTFAQGEVGERQVHLVRQSWGLLTVLLGQSLQTTLEEGQLVS